FSITWDGFIKPLFSQTYTIFIQHDDGARVYINNVPIIDQFADTAPIEHSGTISLVAGQLYPIHIDYRESAQGARAILSWQSASQAKQVIPASQLFAPPALSSTMTTFEGNAWTAFVAFTDPGTDTFAGSTVNYGDGTGTVPLAVSGRAFTLSHVYQN